MRQRQGGREDGTLSVRRAASGQHRAEWEHIGEAPDPAQRGIPEDETATQRPKRWGGVGKSPGGAKKRDGVSILQKEEHVQILEGRRNTSF